MLAKAIAAPFRHFGRTLIYATVLGAIPIFGAVIHQGIMVDYLKQVWHGKEDHPPLNPRRHIEYGIKHILATLRALGVLLLPVLLFAALLVLGISNQVMAAIAVLCLFCLCLWYLLLSYLAPAVPIVYADTGSFTDASDWKKLRAARILGGGDYFKRWFISFCASAIALVSLTAVNLLPEILLGEQPELGAYLVLLSICCLFPLVGSYLSLFNAYLFGSLRQTIYANAYARRAAKGIAQPGAVWGTGGTTLNAARETESESTESVVEETGSVFDRVEDYEVATSSDGGSGGDGGGDGGDGDGGGGNGGGD